jgi:hypothetical protein
LVRALRPQARWTCLRSRTTSPAALSARCG